MAPQTESGAMTPSQARLVRGAAGMVAAQLRGDAEGQGVLLSEYASPQGLLKAVDAFVLYLSAAIQVKANLSEQPWRSVLAALPEHPVHLLPGVTPAWEQVRVLCSEVTTSVTPTATNLEVTSCLEAAYGLCISVTLQLGHDDRDEALAWVEELARLASLET